MKQGDPMHADSAAEGLQTLHADSATMRPALGIKEAAKACRVHEDTMRRAYRRGAFPNATKAAGGAVSIPITDLLAAGYKPNAPTPGQAVTPPTEDTKTTESQAGQEIEKAATLRATIATLEAAKRSLESQVAELKAEKAQLLDLMGLQLKALAAGTPPQATQSRPWWRIGRA